MAQQYKYGMRLYWSDEDHLWLVEVPDLPGAMADGTTPEEVIENWIEVAQIDGRPIPEPRPFMRNNDESARAYPGHVQ